MSSYLQEWLKSFAKYVAAPAFLFFIAAITWNVLEGEKTPARSYITHLGQPVTTEPLYIAADDCRKLADVLALSPSARKEFSVSCAK